MTGRVKTKGKRAEVTVEPSGSIVTTPTQINLHNLEAVSREQRRVYRDMRFGRIPAQEGTRLVYVLAEIGKMFELCEFERRIAALEGPT